MAWKTSFFIRFLEPVNFIVELFKIFFLKALFFNISLRFRTCLLSQHSFFLLFLLFSLFNVSKLFFKLTNDLLDHVFFFISFVCFHFGNERVEPVFDHVFSSCFFQNRNKFAPSLSILSNIFKDREVFFRGPVSMLFLVIQMIQPSFSAVFRAFEHLEVGSIEVISGHIVPFS